LPASRLIRANASASMGASSFDIVDLSVSGGNLV
jgi:hypothetical protein